VVDRERLAALVAAVGAFHVTDRGLRAAQARITAALAAGEVEPAAVSAYLSAIRRYFEPYEREARGQLRHVDRELERLYQLQYNLRARRRRPADRGRARRPRRPCGSAARMKVLDEVGRDTTSVFAYAGGVSELLVDSLRFIVMLQIRVGETFDQAFLLGVQSWPIVVLTALFTGMVFSLESAVQAVEYGVGNLVGGVVAFSTVRELGPMLSAVVVAGRTGAAIAAELGSMTVTEQIEALQSLGLSPTRMLVVPRLVALVVMLPLLAMIADVVSILGGMWVAHVYAHISYESFIDSARFIVPFGDVLRSLVKSAVFAVIIAIVGAYQGLSTRGGAAGVGRSTTGAVVVSVILIFIFNLALSYLLYGGS